MDTHPSYTFVSSAEANYGQASFILVDMIILMHAAESIDV